MITDVPDEVVEAVAAGMWPWSSTPPSWVEQQARAMFSDPEAVRALIEWVGSVTEPEGSR